MTDRHHQAWTAAGIRRAAAGLGVTLPDDYARAVTAAGLTLAETLAVTRLGAGVVIHTRPDRDDQLPVVVGYADAGGQWNRDGTRFQPPAPAAPEAPAVPGVGL